MKKLLIGMLLVMSLALVGCPKEEAPVDTPDPNATSDQGLKGEPPQTDK
jgi:hypothetical protein